MFRILVSGLILPVNEILSFGHGGAGGEEPAVAEDALDDVLPARAVHVDRGVVRQLEGTLPREVLQLALGPRKKGNEKKKGTLKTRPNTHLFQMQIK